MPGGSRASGKDHAALALAGGKTHREAATAAAVSDRTIANWLQDAGFKRRVSELRSGLVKAAAGKLAAAMSRAAAVLEELLASADQNVRCRAATQLLTQAVRVSEIAELQQEIEAIKAALSAREGKT